MLKNNGKFLCVGYGNVGQAIPKRCDDLGLVQSEYIVRSSGIYSFNKDKSEKFISGDTAFWENDKVIKDVKIAFLSIPSFEDGKRAFEIIEGLLSKNIKVVTSEKGAFANFYPELEPKLDEIGISATVGGGTGLVSYLAGRVNPRTNQIHAILNGTLNFIMHGIAEGGTAGQVIDQAVTLGYAEPGATNHLDVINGEIVGDIPKKTSIIWNSVMRPLLDKNKFLKVEDLFKSPQPPISLDQKSLNRLISEAGSRRFIVSIIKDSEEIAEDDIIAGFRKELGNDWIIIGGFRRISDNPLFKALKIPGPGNGVVIAGGPNESDGVYQTSGPGAGAGPTAAAMAQDARRLINRS